MKKYITAIFLFVITAIVLNTILDVAISCHLQGNGDRRYEGWNDIINRPINADLLIIGSSRARLQFSPMIIDSVTGLNVYNMGTDGEPLNQWKVKYSVYSHYQEKRPDVLVITIGYFGTFGSGIGFEREQYFPHLIIPYVRQQFRQIEPFTWAELYVPLYRYTTYMGLYSLLTGWRDDGLYKGYKPVDKKWDGTAYNLQESWHFWYDEDKLQQFDEFLSARKAEGILLVFCYPPIYIGLTHKVDNIDECYQFFQSLADKYDIPIMDYTYSPLCNDTAYFYNATHLNKLGAESFSLQFALDLDNVLRSTH